MARLKLALFIIDQYFQQGLNWEGGLMMADPKRIEKSRAHGELIRQAIEQWRQL